MVGVRHCARLVGETRHANAIARIERDTEQLLKRDTGNFNAGRIR